MAGLKTWTDDGGFHRSRRTLELELRKLLADEAAADAATMKRVVNLLLMIFSNQELIYDSLGELRKEEQNMTGAVNNESQAISDLTDAVNSGVAIEQSAVNLLATLEGQVATLTQELADAGTTVDNSPALQALTATVAGGAKALSDALNSVGGIGGSGTTTTVPPTDGGDTSAPTDGSSVPTDGGDSTTAPTDGSDPTPSV